VSRSEIKGHWETHTRYGQQFTFTVYQVRLPATVDGIRSYLESGFIKGVGPRLIDRIIGHFKADTLAVIEAESESTYRGGRHRQKDRPAHRRGMAIPARSRTIGAFSGGNGVDTAYAGRLLREYGTDVIDILVQRPLPGGRGYSPDRFSHCRRHRSARRYTRR
jgi:exodeoxyribonuclease V alpha subunit